MPDAVLLVEQGDSFIFSWRRLAAAAGPGLLIAIAYVDPGNLESDLQTGATTGFSLLWLLVVTTFLGFFVQMQAARVGVASGKNLAELCRHEYPRVPSLTLWVMTEVAIIGSDVQEVIGSAIAVALLSQGAVPLWAGALLSAGVSFLLLLVVEKAGVRQLELLFAGLIGIMIATFGYMFASADVPMAEVAKGLVVPRLPRAYVPTAVALFGSLIMPHNIYLHSALVQTRGLQGASQRTKMNALTYFGIESGVALVAATFINIFVVGVFAAGFFKPDGPPPDIGLQNAGVFLGATYGSVVVTVWGVGLLAAGQSSTMTGTYTGQFVMSGWLDWKVSAWQRIIVTRSVALVPTMAVALMMDPDSTQLDRLNQGLNLLQSIQLPFALVPLLSITGCQRLMGGLAMSGPGLAAAWAVAALVVCINMSAVAEVATVWVEAAAGVSQAWGWAVTASVAMLVLAYVLFIIYLVLYGPGGRREPGKAAGSAVKYTATGVDEEGAHCLAPGSGSASQQGAVGRALEQPAGEREGKMQGEVVDILRAEGNSTQCALRDGEEETEGHRQAQEGPAEETEWCASLADCELRAVTSQ